MANFDLIAKQFDPNGNSGQGSVGAELTHTLVVNGQGSDNRVRYHKDWIDPQTNFRIDGQDIPLGKMSIRLVYIMLDQRAKKFGGQHTEWERKYVINPSAEEINFAGFQPNQAKIIWEQVNNGGVLRVDDANGDNIMNVSRMVYAAFNQRIKNSFICKDIFDISLVSPTYLQPTIYAISSNHETAASANDGKIRVFPLGGEDTTKYQTRLFEDLVGNETWTAVPGDNWADVVGDFTEYTNLAPRTYQVRVRDGANTLGRNEPVIISAFS